MRAFHGSRLPSLVTFVGALAGVAACGPSGGSTSAAETTETGAQAASLETADTDVASKDQGSDAGADGERSAPRGFGRHQGGPPGGGGPEFLFGAALHELALSDAQKASIQAELDKAASGRRPPGPPAGASLAALAQAVRAGTIDVSALAPKVAAPDAGAQAQRAQLATSLRVLHATLTSEQRRELVAAVEKRSVGEGRGPVAGEGRGPKGERRGPGFGGERGPRPEGATTAEAGAPGVGAHVPGPLGFLLEGVELTQTQRDAIAKALEARRPSEANRDPMSKRYEAMRAAMRAQLASFAGDAFDAAAFVTPPEGAKAGGPGHPLEGMVRDLAVVVPLLEPAQRDALASRLEQGPPGLAAASGHRAPRGRR